MFPHLVVKEMGQALTSCARERPSYAVGRLRQPSKPSRPRSISPSARNQLGDLLGGPGASSGSSRTQIPKERQGFLPRTRARFVYDRVEPSQKLMILAVRCMG